MIQCPRCGPKAPISVEMVSGGIRKAGSKVYKCEVCNLPIEPPVGDHAVATAVRTDREDIPRAAPVASPATAEVVEAAPEVVEQRTTKPRRKSADPDFDVVKAARAQLKELDKEIRRLRKLEKRRDELKRLLDAAAGKPRAVVRNLRANTG